MGSHSQFWKWNLYNIRVSQLNWNWKVYCGTSFFDGFQLLFDFTFSEIAVLARSYIQFQSYSLQLEGTWKIGQRFRLISSKLTNPEFLETFPGTDLVSTIYIWYCRLIPICWIWLWCSLLLVFCTKLIPISKQSL